MEGPQSAWGLSRKAGPQWPQTGGYATALIIALDLERAATSWEWSARDHVRRWFNIGLVFPERLKVTENNMPENLATKPEHFTYVIH